MDVRCHVGRRADLSVRPLRCIVDVKARSIRHVRDSPPPHVPCAVGRPSTPRPFIVVPWETHDRHTNQRRRCQWLPRDTSSLMPELTSRSL